MTDTLTRGQMLKKSDIFNIQRACGLREKLLQFAVSAICVDATHGVTHYKGYLLVTVMVITDQGKGYPAAWFIVSKETEDVLTICFKELRGRYVTDSNV